MNRAGPHFCQFCSYSSWHRGNLNKHVKQVHADIRPHQCPYCEKKFKRTAHLKRHTEIHTRPEAEVIAPTEIIYDS